MLFVSYSDLTLMLQLISRWVRPAKVLPTFCPVLLSLCALKPPAPVPSWHQGSLMWCPAAVQHRLQGSPCCVFRCSIFLDWTQQLFELLLPWWSGTSLPSPLWPHQQGIVIHTAPAQWMSSLFWTILCKSWGWLWVNISMVQGLQNYWDQPIWLVHLCHIQNPLNSLSSLLWCWFDLQQVVLTAPTVESMWVFD